MRACILTLLTDFGTQDGYAGAMKGVILRELGGALPGAHIVDITHDIPPQDVLSGAFALAQAAPRFPAGTVHVAVVDPGVGTERHAILIEDGGQTFIGPDNGLLTLAASAKGRIIDRVPPDWSIHPTFHGRDLFARVAARIAAGTPGVEFATRPITPRALELPRPTPSSSGLLGEVIHVDRFGNLITNLPAQDLPTENAAAIALEVDCLGGLHVPCRTTYGDVAPGDLVAYAGSAGYYELGVRDGSAAVRLGLGRGAAVRLVRVS